MEIVGDKDALNQNTVDARPADPAGDAGTEQSREAVINNFNFAMAEAHAEADAAVAKSAQSEPESGGMVGKSVDVVDHVSSDSDLKSALIDKMKELDSMSSKDRTVKIEQKHKDAFLDCIVSGERYMEEFSLFGGKIRVKVRCRSSEETDAIEAYARREISAGRITLNSEYATLMRKLLLAAQIEEVNGVKYDTLKKPLFYIETKDGLTPPAWSDQIDLWASKPDYLVASLFECIIGFEARYWGMIRESKNENFWKSGESTGA
jgi:hypothetical protein